MASKRIKWSPAMDAALRDCAAAGLSGAETASVVGTPADAVYRRAKKLSMSFQSSEHGSLRGFLAAGGRLIREDVGGGIGIRWGRAHRSGAPFATSICETLLRYGVLISDGTTYRSARAS